MVKDYNFELRWHKGREGLTTPFRECQLPLQEYKLFSRSHLRRSSAQLSVGLRVNLLPSDFLAPFLFQQEGLLPIYSRQNLLVIKVSLLVLLCLVAHLVCILH